VHHLAPIEVNLVPIGDGLLAVRTAILLRQEEGLVVGRECVRFWHEDHYFNYYSYYILILFKPNITIFYNKMNLVLNRMALYKR